MSKILKCLRVYNFEDLYIYSKLSFLNSLQKKDVTNYIFLSLNSAKRNKLSKSFVQDIKLLEGRFHLNIETIHHECIILKNSLKKNFMSNDGITHSINNCLKNIRSKKYKIILDGLIKPKFIKEDEELQETLQYFIITNVIT